MPWPPTISIGGVSCISMAGVSCKFLESFGSNYPIELL